MQKKPLTHRLCIKSNYTILKIIASIFLIAVLAVPIVIFFDGAALTDDDLGGLVFGVIFGGIFAILGIVLLINTLKTRAKLMARKYYIYMDMVGHKKVQHGSDSVSYVLYFANNKYTKAVSRKKFETIQIGTPYYLVQVQGEKRAMAAFAEAEYYLDESVRKQVRGI